MATRRHTIFNQNKATCDELEMTKMMSFKYNWNNEIICQFYATLYFDADAQKLMWMTDRRQYEIIVCVFASLLALEHQLTMESDNRIHTYNVLKSEEMLFMYALGAKPTPLKIHNFHLFHATLAPRIGDATAYPQYERNLIQYYVEKKPFSVFDYIFVEIPSISKTVLCNCGYAPQIMMMTLKITGIAFVKDIEITNLKPQFPDALVISMDVPSSSAAPRTTHSGTAAPPPTSSSTGGILRVHKSMFCMCQDTRQC
jgi:hypothetical protein